MDNEKLEYEIRAGKSINWYGKLVYGKVCIEPVRHTDIDYDQWTQDVGQWWKKYHDHVEISDRSVTLIPTKNYDIQK